MSLLLALDLGTTGVRALCIEDDGQVRGRAYRPLAVSFPEAGRVEQDPDEMWMQSVEVLRAALADAGSRAAEIAGIGVVNQRSTVIAWDAETCQALAPAIGWQDQRTRARVDEFRRLGIPLNTLASATKFEWWMREDGEVAKAARAGRLRLGTPDAWLTARLTAGDVHVSDPSNASCTALFDIAAGEWSAALCELFAVPVEALPRIAPTSGVVGESPASLLGAPVPIAARAGDQQSAAFAQGVHAAGQAKLTLGTSAMLDLHTGEEPAEPGPGTYPVALWLLADGTRAAALEGTVITAGAALDWLVGIGVAGDAAEIDRLAQDCGEAADEVLFVPALQGLGTPYMDDAATGALLGLTRAAGREQIARAVLDGVAHRLADLCETLAPSGDTLPVDGGLARSDPLLQRLADWTGLRVARAAEVETTALGAAALAGLATAAIADLAACRALSPRADVFEPRCDAAARREVRERWSEAVARTRRTVSG